MDDPENQAWGCAVREKLLLLSTLTRGAYLLPEIVTSDDGRAELVAHRLPLRDAGCGWFVFLVASGEHAGFVWEDASASGEGIVRSRRTFGPWYEHSLDHRLRLALPGARSCRVKKDTHHPRGASSARASR